MAEHAPSRGDRHLIQSPRARGEAREVTDRSRRARESSTGRAEPRWYPIATLLLLALGVWTFLGAFILGYPYTVIGQNSALRALGAAIVLILCGVWIRRLGFSAVATTVAGLVGAALVWSAFALPHESARIRADEGIVGALVVVVCVAIAATARSGR